MSLLVALASVIILFLDLFVYPNILVTFPLTPADLNAVRFVNLKVPEIASFGTCKLAGFFKCSTGIGDLEARPEVAAT
jgi:hypothetical protein